MKYLNLLIASIGAKLIINSPESLRKQFEEANGSNIVESVYANFGRIPYGQSIVSILYSLIYRVDTCTSTHQTPWRVTRTINLRTLILSRITRSYTLQ